jgi:hypothetical protein
LVAVAWTESRGNPLAAAGTRPNSARGLFQLRPKSAFAHQLARYVTAPQLLFDPALSTALAAWYAWRLRNFKDPGQVLDWLAIRRGWALPRLVDDVDEVAVVKGKGGVLLAPGERSKQTRWNFSQALPRAGLPQSFMYEYPFRGLRWPGIWQVMNAVGVDYNRLGIVPPGTA